MTLLKTKNLSVSLDGHQILYGVNFELRAGEMVGLVGPNGAGKSTLVKALAGIIKAQAGEILIRERNLSALDGPELAKEVAYLPQSQPIHWPLLVERVVALGRFPHLMPWQSPGKKDFDAVGKALKETDIFHLKNRTIDRLAGGEKSLVMLARVLAVESSMILADEPVQGLDPYHEIQVMEVLKNLTAKGKGVLVVLHNLNLAARFCDRMYLLHQGGIVASGCPKEVLSPDHLRSSYRVAAKYGGKEDFFVLPWKRL